MAMCVECGQRQRYRRGLCTTCYRDRSIRERYADGRAHNGCEDDMTEAEVEAMVAEQMQCLPDWWAEDVAAQAEKPAGWVVPFLRRDRRHKGMDASEGK